MMRVIASLLTLLVIGCHYPGTWQDDPENWERAYGSAKPDDVVVLHSYYWRSPHWSLEFCYAFQFQANEKLREAFIKANTAKRVEGEKARTEVKDRRRLFTGDSPVWLLPKDADRYEVWKEQDCGDSFRMFIDKDNGDFFVTGEQI